MAGKSTIIDYNLCDFKYCKDGICRAIPFCDKKVLKQEAAFEPPYIDSNMCSGCNKCIPACPSGAIQRNR
jgi:NAD-dependent dihydropyrimidine dehydrogenase PreA subunit